MIHLRTVQGIGDLHWVIQQIMPLAQATHPEGRFHFSVLTIDNSCPVQTRASEYLSLIPGLTHGFQRVAPEEYHRVAALKSMLPENPAEWTDKIVDYSVNRWLEEGTSLYEIDPRYQVLEKIELAGAQPPAARAGLCLYVSGTQRGIPEVWTPEQWVTAVEKAIDGLELQQGVTVVGAPYDAEGAQPVIDMLKAVGHGVRSYVGKLGLLDTLAQIRASEFFMGHQSGLCVLAENYDHPHLSIDYNKFPLMKHTWQKPGSTTHHAMLYGEFDRFEEFLP